MTHQPGNVAIDLTPESAGRVLRLAEAAREGAPDLRSPVPGFQVLGLLGEGGAGQVYLAQREGAPELVALKVFRARLDTEERQRRAWREIDLLSTLRLPCVPRILGWGVHDGAPWIASEFIDGPPLDDAARTMERRERVALLARVAEAVQEVHVRGIIHRDLKPANILVTDRGDPVIIDFGLAAEGEAPVQTLDDAPRGTLGFMAPEQARGERHAITTRTDVFALGATAMLLLTGEGPHPAPTTLHEGLRCAADEPARDPRTIDPTLDRALAAVLAKAVAFAPEGRYASAAEFAADLRRWLKGEPVAARTAGGWLRFTRWLGRHPIAATAAACAAIMGLTVAGSAGYLAWWNARHRTPVRFVLGEHSSTLDLYARSGEYWGSVTVAQGWIHRAIVISGDETGGRPLLVTAVRQWDNTGFEVISTLRAYTLGRDGPLELWSFHPNYPRWADDEYKDPSRGSTFSCFCLKRADVFPECPGEEIISVHIHGPYSQTLIAVHDLEGELLYDIWHDGHLSDIYWDDANRLLICAGVNSDGDWRDRADPTNLAPNHNVHPPVLFALQPVKGDHGRDIRPGHPKATAEAVWYRCLLPAEFACQFRFGYDDNVLMPRFAEVTKSGKSVIATAGLLVLKPDLSMTGAVYDGIRVDWDVTADGPVGPPRVADQTEILFANESKLPRPASLMWGELPARKRGASPSPETSRRE